MFFGVNDPGTILPVLFVGIGSGVDLLPLLLVFASRLPPWLGITVCTFSHFEPLQIVFAPKTLLSPLNQRYAKIKAAAANENQKTFTNCLFGSFFPSENLFVLTLLTDLDFLAIVKSYI